MPQSLAAIYIHMVFSTKERRRFLQDPILRMEMHAFLGGISKRLDCPCIIVGGTEDHVHQMIRLARTITPADWIKEIKRVSTHWIRQREPRCNHFAWQAGYGAFSVSASNLDIVKKYIAAQEEHHRKIGFQEEFRMMLKKHNLEWDERYLWD